MSGLTLLAGIVAAGLLIYLIVSLIFPEDLS